MMYSLVKHYLLSIASLWFLRIHLNGNILTPYYTVI